jgi:PIN domain nuclease of toxin-antitoxin system
MRLLLDTHALLWWWTEPDRLSQRAMKALTDESNEILVSAASAWEIATKNRIGKLGLHEVEARFDEMLRADGFAHLPVTARHALRAGAYGHPHRDPFDRMLAAQAELEGLQLVSCDSALTPFPVRCLW